MIAKLKFSSYASSIICLCFLFLFLSTGPIFSQNTSSARIMALGGETVSGIIPDYYTDLMINPALAASADRLTINCGIRHGASKKMGLLHLHNNFILSEQYVNSPDYTNGIDIYGVPLLGWKTAFSSEWRFSDDESSNSRMDEGLSYDASRYTTEYYNYCSKDSRDFWRLSLAAARNLGRKLSLGVRIGALGYYYTDQYRRLNYEERYIYNNEKYGYIMDEEYRNDYAYPVTKRHFSIYLQLGIHSEKKENSFSDLMLDISRNSNFFSDESWDINSYREYDYTNDALNLDRYHYDLEEYNESNEGDLWNFQLRGRHRYPSGVTLYAGGGYETSNSDISWLTNDINYRWDTDKSTKTSFMRTIKGEGSFYKMNFFSKVGKRFSISKKLDLITSFASFADRRHFEQTPNIKSNSLKRTSNDTLETFSSGRISLSSETNEITTYFPISAEFKPAEYFTLFGAFKPYFHWRKTTNRIAIPTSIVSIVQREEIYNIKEHNSDFAASYTITIGCSLHYSNKLFFDIYSASDITPDNLSSLIVDMRYLF